jgi:putative transposase
MRMNSLELLEEHNQPEERFEILREHVDRLDLPDCGKAYVLEVASSPPSRKVGRHRNRNLICDVPIPRLGVVLQAESATGEYFFLLELSRRRDVIAIFDQPLSVPITITTKKAVKTPITYTPDFLAVFEGRVETYEIKADTELDRLCQERNLDWISTDGSYAYVPAMRYFNELGIKHVTLPNSTVSAIRADNLRLLSSVRGVTDTPQLFRLRQRIERLINDVDAIRIGDLLAKVGTNDATAVLQLIDEGTVHADFDASLLASPNSVWISRDPDLPRLMTKSAPRIDQVLAKQGSVSTNLVANPKYEVEIVRRFAACGLVTTDNSLFPKPKAPRTVRRHLKDYRDSGHDPNALIPQWSKSGNRTSRRSVEHQKLIDDAIVAGKSDSNRSTPAMAFHAYLSAFEASALSAERHVAPCTFYKAYRFHRPTGDYAMARGGRRESNALKSPIDPLNRSLLATRAFSLAHIDHYEVDIEILVGRLEKRKLTRRAWLTAMVDASTGEVLALWLSFRSPCRQSCAMAIRDCVRRHGRLPEIIVVDGGPEFDSVHFTALLAVLGVTRINRPPEDPRFGKEVERLFGVFKERFARGLPGFITGIQNARKCSGSHSATKRAELRFHHVIDVLEDFVFNGYNHEPKPQCMESRLALRAQSDDKFPFSGKRVLYDISFLVQTAVEAPGAHYELSPGRGIRVYGVWYNCAALVDYFGPKKLVTVRVEPFNKSVVYVCLNGLWHVTRSAEAMYFSAIPESEAIGLTTEHQQLGSLRSSMALEEEHRSYERKMGALEKRHELCSDALPEGEKIQGNHPAITKKSGSRDWSDVKDLTVEGEVL